MTLEQSKLEKLESWHVRENEQIRARNLESVKKYVEYKVGRPLPLHNLIPDWSPAKFMNYHERTKVRPVKNSLTFDDEGYATFIAQGDSKIDYNPKTGHVEVSTKVKFDPATIYFKNNFFRRRLFEEEKEPETLHEEIQQTFRESQYYLNEIPDFAIENELKELRREAGFHERNPLHTLIDSGIILGLSGILGIAEKDTAYNTGTAQTMMSMLMPDRFASLANIFRADQLSIDYELDSLLEPLAGAAYELEKEV